MRSYAMLTRISLTLAMLGSAVLTWAQLSLTEAERLARNLNPILAVSKADVEAAEAAAGGLESPF